MAPEMSPLLAVCSALLVLPFNIFAANPEFRSDYTFDGASQAFYKEHPPKTWSDAASQCVAEGAQLAAPRTEAQVRALTRLMGKKTASVWVGIHDLLAQGSYMTLDGGECEIRIGSSVGGWPAGGPQNTIRRLQTADYRPDQAGFSSSEIFMKWKKSEPTNVGGNENCIQMDRAGEYNDTLCDLQCNFVCKKELSKDESIDECTTVYCVLPPPDTTQLGKEFKKNYEGEISVKPFFREDYVYESAFTTFYKGHREVVTWHEAVATCAAEGASLAAPATEGERSLLMDLMWSPSLWAGEVWLGVHDMYSEGRFILLNGSSVSDVHVNWAAGQPDNRNGNENCVQMKIKGGYYDISCESRRRFVCKKELSAVSRTNTLCETHDTEYVYSLDADRCYKLHTTPRNWHDALKICLAEGAILGIINSEEEAKIYKSTIQTKSPPSIQGKYNRKLLHSGFTDLLTPGDFKTVKGETLAKAGYEQWYPNQPDNHGGNEHCGSMVIADASLNDIGCETEALFICEKSIGRPLSRDSSLKYGKGEISLCAKDNQ